MRIGIAQSEALCLYVSILTDTGSFCHSNTTSKTHSIVSDILNYGINPADVAEKVYQKNTVNTVRLMGMVLKTLRIESNGRIAHITVTPGMLKKAGAKPIDTENFIEIARSIKDVDVAIFFKQNFKKGRVNVSLRSKGRVDVNKVARKFGGGGHRKAAGCVIEGSARAVKDKVIGRVKRALKN
jgi:phosphoesterase RecJ-like protein